MKTKQIDCHKCRHYYVTWNPKLPHGCRAMGFRGRYMPSIAVRRISGMACLMYAEKKNNNSFRDEL
jgi:hypothetical protein